jgi:endonuclease-3
MKKEQKNLATEILGILRSMYQKREEDFVVWSNPLELLIATVLSAQCTDKKVNGVTNKIFKKYRTAEDYMNADLECLEREIYSLGFYRTKSKYLKGIGFMLCKKFCGKVPQTREELIQLPGVSFKTANLILAKAFGENIGIAVDTHVHRLAPRLGLTKQKQPVRIAKDLERLYPARDYLDVNEYFILHGRAVCKPKPRCSYCKLADICPSSALFFGKISESRTGGLH